MVGCYFRHGVRCLRNGIAVVIGDVRRGGEEKAELRDEGLLGCREGVNEVLRKGGSDKRGMTL